MVREEQHQASTGRGIIEPEHTRSRGRRTIGLTLAALPLLATLPLWIGHARAVAGGPVVFADTVVSEGEAASLGDLTLEVSDITREDGSVCAQLAVLQGDAAGKDGELAFELGLAGPAGTVDLDSRWDSGTPSLAAGGGSAAWFCFEVGDDSPRTWTVVAFAGADASVAWRER